MTAWPLAILVEAWLGPTLGWVSVPTRTEAGGGGIRIKRDRKPGATLPDPGTCSIVVDNASGDWSPRNPRGQFYGLLGRNTPVRVGWNGLIRFVGEVASWAPGWSISAADRYVTVQAAGILRRLFASNTAPRSPMRRAFAASGPVAYWPMEDGVASSQIGSALTGHPPLTVSGPTPAFVDVADQTWGTADYQTVRYGTGRVVDLAAGGSLSATLPGSVAVATATAWSVLVAALTDYTTIPGDVVLLDVATPGGTFVRWQLVQTESPYFGIQLFAYDATGTRTTIAQSAGLGTGFLLHELSVWQSGGTINATIDQGSGVGSSAGLLAGITSVGVNTGGQTSTGTMPFGHLTVWAASSTPPAAQYTTTSVYGRTVYGATLSYWREPATVRLARLCAEQGVPLDMPAVTEDDDVLLGWQPSGTFADLVAHPADADGGMLLETRDALSLSYRPRVTLYNQTPAVQLDYAAGYVAAPLAPADDDDQVANDVTVERVDGSTVRAVEQTGPLSVLPPPDGIGPYETSTKLNLLADGQLPDQAYWRLHVGTVNESRYDAIRVQLDGAALDADAAATAAAVAVDGGDLVELVALPAWLPPGPVPALVQGYEETADSHTWSITWTATPGSPWTVASADGEPRVPADGTTLTADITAAAGSLQITSTAANGPWTVDPADFPLDVLIGGGELVTLSGIVGAGLTQTATASARAVNGVSRGWLAGTTVDVALPAVAPL